MNNAITSFRDDYHFLSNFYGPLEAAYQAAKSQDDEVRKVFQYLPPNKAKTKGQKLILRPDWDQIKLDLMYRLVKQKFVRNRELRAKLLLTHDAMLVEGNRWHDNFWGQCACRKCMIGGCFKPNEQSNHLGRILMQIRDELKGRLPIKRTQCPKCHGSGLYGTGPAKCVRCIGKGWMDQGDIERFRKWLSFHPEYDATPAEVAMFPEALSGDYGVVDAIEDMGGDL